ncbi:peptidase M10A [Actinokineospora globicatena]|uniref:Matrixin n=1 Tax=Actinokineospora globicatena TaxID=103729 RepID=A0A9W6QFM5_9PSEU|nr:peptidase M10A [Actinokineospora globicatena]GLW89201.1 hypothetical protein Aglo03_00170 [Actinokineospora globicatena]
MRRSQVTVAVATLLAAAVAVVPGAVRGPTVADEQVFVVGQAIYAADEDDAQYAGAAAPTEDTACSDSSYAIKTWRVTGVYNWYYNGDGAPPAVASTALASITSSGDTVGKGLNRCGLANSFTTSYKYAGTSTAKPQVAADLTCTGNDGKSVTGWGALPPKVLAYTCTFFNAKGVVIASDALIDNVVYTWFTSKPANCAGQLYDLETTMTHERLHTAGLAHVDQVRNAAQTMTPSSAPCDTSRRLLGAGDYAGLKAAGTVK